MAMSSTREIPGWQSTRTLRKSTRMAVSLSTFYQSNGERGTVPTMSTNSILESRGTPRGSLNFSVLLMTEKVWTQTLLWCHSKKDGLAGGVKSLSSNLTKKYKAEDSISTLTWSSQVLLTTSSNIVDRSERLRLTNWLVRSSTRVDIIVPWWSGRETVCSQSMTTWRATSTISRNSLCALTFGCRWTWRMLTSYKTYSLERSQTMWWSVRKKCLKIRELCVFPGSQSQTNILRSGSDNSGFNDKISVIFADVSRKVSQSHLYQLVVGFCQQFLHRPTLSVYWLHHRLHLLNMIAHLHYFHLRNVELLWLFLDGLVKGATVFLPQGLLVLFKFLLFLLSIQKGIHQGLPLLTQPLLVCCLLIQQC